MQNRWTQEEEAAIEEMFRRGADIEEICDTLDRTPGSIRLKLHHLGLVILADTFESRDSFEESQEDAARRTDLAFQASMTAAIRAGAERAPIGVVKTPDALNARFIPRITGSANAGYRSAALLCAEMSVESN
jgi:hypothetical protein